MNCLIGYTGFVGGNLAAQRRYDVLINSKNFHDMEGQDYDRIVCAGVPAVKWKANKDPEGDIAHINELVEVLKTVSCGKFVLISTIDVYPVNTNADEDFDCHAPDHHAYGRHRLYFEEFCRNHFSDVMIVRLPGLFGKGIKKNVIFDLLHDNCLEMINPESCFQYYYLRYLSDDIDLAEKQGIPLINLFTEPIRTRTILERFFPAKEIGAAPSPLARYDLFTKYSRLRGKTGRYLYSAEEVLAQLNEFIESERHG
ncbi:MAG: NAD(P)-dependent oxidoreductase [Lentisphaeria bacterium]|nr:NAD(P)-dependent oxidoreductase [Lentisphaeria bacterium]